MCTIIVYSLCPIDSNLFAAENNISFSNKIIEDAQFIKKTLNIYGGIKLHSKNYMSIYLKSITNLIYLNFLPKDSLFCLQVYSVLINRVIFFFPLDDYELECFNGLLLDNKVSKMIIYSTGLVEVNKYILQEFVKDIKIKLCYYRKSKPISIKCPYSLLQSIRYDISSISGKNVFCNRIYDLKF